MTEPSTESTPRRSSLARDVAVIVLAGIALGLSFNALQASARSPRALSWIRHEPKLASFESLAGTLPEEVPAAAAVRPAPEPTPQAVGSAPAPVATSAGTKPVPVTPSAPSAPAAPAQQGVKPTGKPAATPPAAPAGTPAQPQIVTDESVAAPVPVVLPVVPETREPLEVGLDFTKRFHAGRGAAFVDARSAEEYAEGHIPGAASLPFDDVYKKPELAKAFDEKGLPIIVYCGGGDCDLARTLAYALIEAGHKRVLVFKDGLPGWAAAGMPVTKGAQP
ncbi:MAG: rhodanese-like domain-containing protein [Candidatus Eisenbacteria bacterium]|uniref:Rhodanese-like domain-containing protein n=1 Tax=Eiseniibacteriota bacterium TaxID=2212470 RepID=A0A933SI25_UNCEI|nr:rhodanese-like domain-containing protein [Candidatus Eisenbacteria bacterium]